jgi:MFS transporter, DHA2 family, multidrug resistance protein
MRDDLTVNAVWTGGKNPWVITFVVTIATFMEMLDTSVANVALPHMAGSLSVSQDETSWVLTSYLVANAVMLPVSGWISGRIGRKRYYMLSVALFTLSSLSCGLSDSIEWLVFSRLLQGLGGGGLAPTEQAILADTFPAEKRGMAMAMYGMAIVLAPAIGPTVGGVITDHYSWRWIFLINVPVGLVSLYMTQRWVSDPPHFVRQRDRSPVDYVGLLLLVVGLVCLELGLSTGEKEDWLNSAAIRAYFGVACVALVAFAAWEVRQAAPIVDVRSLRDPGFAAINLMMLCTGVVLYGTTLLLPQYVQRVMHYTAQQAGAVLSPGGLVVMILMPVVGKLVARKDPRWLVCFGFAWTSFALFYMSRHLYPAIDLRTAIGLRCLQTIGIAFLFVPINTLAYEGVPMERRRAVASIVNLSRNMGGELGIALVTSFVTRRSQVEQEHLSAQLSAADPRVSSALQQLGSVLERSGYAAHDALMQAQALLYQRVLSESITLATLEALRVIAVLTACMVPLAYLARRTGFGAGVYGVSRTGTRTG